MDRCQEKRSIIKKAKLISDPVDAEEHNTSFSVELQEKIHCNYISL